MLKLEIHTHTKASKDSFLNKYFYLLMLKLRKIDVIAITDHNEIYEAKNIRNFLEPKGIKVIIGEEIMSSRGEIIGLFLNEKITPGLSPKDTMLEIKKQKGIVYIPHPYDEKRYKTVLSEEEIRQNLDIIDFVEIHNGRNIKKDYSNQQQQIAKRYNKKGLVGSDAHLFFELGRNYNILDCTKGEIEKEENLKKKLFTIEKFETKNCKKRYHILTKFVRIIKNK